MSTDCSSLHTRCSYAPPPSSSSSCTASSQPQLGTILFHGPVPPTKGLWYGVEWDEPARGRHSGVYGKTGVRYFQPRVEGAGSFLRPDVRGLDVRGKSFEEALQSKYHDDVPPPGTATSTSTPHAGSGSDSTSQRFSTESNFDVEVVLSSRVTERFHQLGRLQEVGLEWEGVSCATQDVGDEEGRERAEEALAELGGRLNKLKTLNLSFSLLPTLQEAERISGALPQLTNLSLNGNRFRRLLVPTLLPGFKRLRRLQLNSTLMDWFELRYIATSLPNLEDLEFGHNRLASLHSNPSVQGASQERTPILPKLARLNLEANELSDWAEVVDELSCLSSLAELILTGNRFTSLILAEAPPSASPADSAPVVASLASLRNLSLADNCLSAWSKSVDALAGAASSAFPSLVSLRLAGNPLFATDSPTSNAVSSSATGASFAAPSSPPSRAPDRAALHSRLITIARLPFVTELEGTPVSSSERLDAERYWLEQLAKDEGIEGGLSEWLRGRVKVLREKHGWSDTRGNGDAAGKAKATLKDRLIHLHIRPPPTSSTPTAAPPSLSVLPTLRTLLFRTQLSRLLGLSLPKSKYRLVAVLRPAEGETEEVRVDIPPAEEGKEVRWWGLGDGDAIEVVQVE